MSRGFWIAWTLVLIRTSACSAGPPRLCSLDCGLDLGVQRLLDCVDLGLLDGLEALDSFLMLPFRPPMRFWTFTGLGSLDAVDLRACVDLVDSTLGFHLGRFDSQTCCPVDVKKRCNFARFFNRNGPPTSSRRIASFSRTF